MNKYDKIARQLTDRFKEKAGVVGVIWVGSAVYGVEDKFVDIDLRLLCQNCQNSAMEQKRIGGIKVEIAEMEMAWLMAKGARLPDTEQYWIRETSRILWDKNGSLVDTFGRENKVSEKVWSDLEWKLYKQLFCAYEFEKCVMRNDVVTARMYVGRLVEVLSRFVFVYRRRAVPTFKWRWRMIKQDELFDVKMVETLFVNDKGRGQGHLKILKEIEVWGMKMMRDKGWSEDRVKEPWRF